MRSEADHGHHGAGVVNVMDEWESLGRDRGSRVESVAVNVKLVLVSIVVAVMTGNRLVRLVHRTGPDMGRISAAVISGVATLTLGSGGSLPKVVVAVAVGVVAEAVGVLFVPPRCPLGCCVLLT